MAGSPERTLDRSAKERIGNYYTYTRYTRMALASADVEKQNPWGIII